MNICLKCPKKYHCCINPRSKGYAAVNIDEALLIKKKTGQDFKKFLLFTKLPKRLASLSKADKAGTEARFRAGMMTDDRILRLKTKKNNECVFLKNGKCSIYSIRPTICRIYPYWFKAGNGRIELVVHQGCEHCDLLSDKLAQKQKNDLIKTAKKIIKQRDYYKKHIKEFIAGSY